MSAKEAHATKSQSETKLVQLLSAKLVFVILVPVSLLSGLLTQSFLRKVEMLGESYKFMSLMLLRLASGSLLMNSFARCTTECSHCVDAQRSALSASVQLIS